jgi:small subunit ribosomal protein S11
MQDLLKVMPVPAAQVASGRAVNDTRVVDTSILGSGAGGLDALSAGADQPDERGGEPYHFHIYSHKHNTHVTVTKPNRDAIVSLSCGNLGFRKSQRKHYDSAYQLGAYVIDKLQQQGWHNKISSLEVALRGFGPGREAITKVILGNEGRLLRDKIVKVSDATRLKFGGTRSKKPRRLG